MSVACPRCSRPDHERLRSCLYCGETLPAHDSPPEPLSPPEPPSAESAIVPSTQAAPPLGEVCLLILQPTPGRADVLEIAEKLAPLFKLDPYGMRQRLLAAAPQVVRRSRDREDLEALRETLARHSIAGTVVSLAEIRGGPPAFQARGLDPAGCSPEAFCFVDGEGSRAVVRLADVAAIVVGRVNVRWTGPSAKVDRRRLLKDAQPSIAEISIDRSDYLEADIHRTAEAPIIRIRVPEFDYSGLGLSRTPSSLLNWKRILDRFRAASPALVYDESFKLAQPAILELDDDEGGWRSNEEQFDLFSRTWAAHWRRISLLRGGQPDQESGAESGVG